MEIRGVEHPVPGVVTIISDETDLGNRPDASWCRHRVRFVVPLSGGHEAPCPEARVDGIERPFLHLRTDIAPTAMADVIERGHLVDRGGAEVVAEIGRRDGGVVRAVGLVVSAHIFRADGLDLAWREAEFFPGVHQSEGERTVLVSPVAQGDLADRQVATHLVAKPRPSGGGHQGLLARMGIARALWVEVL